MKSGKLLPRIKVITAFVVMFQILVVHAMASSELLHKHCHGHADEPSHECAVTLMLHGGYHSESPPVIPVEAVALDPQELVMPPQAHDAIATHLRGGVLAHAPPRGP